jgi:sugar phosphate isomerase/epimerase
MKVNQVAAQIYTVREHLKTPADIAASLKKIRQIGYPAVQAVSTNVVEPAELSKMIKDAGLVACAAHDGGILSDAKAVADKMKVLGSRFVSYPYPGGVKLETLADVKSLAKSLNDAGKVLQDSGVTLTYHNHSIEFRRFDGRLMLDVLYSETNPKYLQAEIDTYWVQHGGGDSEDWCKRLKGRLPLLHMKDYGMTKESKPTFFEIGYGNLDWKKIVAASDAAGCEWYIVEQDTCAGDPFDSLKMSFEYIRDNLCE